MRDVLTPLLHLQRFFLPALLMAVAWAAWRTIWRRDLAVGLALYLGLVIVVDGFFNTGLFLPGLEKGSIRYSEICAFFLLFNRPKEVSERIVSRPIVLSVCAYFTLLLLSAFSAESPFAAIFELRRLIVPQLLAFALGKRGFPGAGDFRRFILALAGLSVLLGLFVFWDVFFDRWLLYSDVLNDPMYFLNRRQGRFGSLFLNPNYLGAFVVLIFPSIFVRTLNESDRRLRLFCWSAALALVFCLLETQSRGPMLAFVLAAVLLVLGPCGGVSRTRRIGLLVAVVVAFSIVMPGFYGHAMRRFDELDRETTTEHRSRQTTWLYTWRVIADRPLAGIGFGEAEFRRAMDGYGFVDAFDGGSFDNPHNSYLQMAVYAGIPALLAFVLANLMLLWKALKGSVSRSRGDTSDMFGVAVGLMAFLVVIYPDMHMFTQTVAPVYWVFFGLLLALVGAPVRSTVMRTAAPSGYGSVRLPGHRCGTANIGRPTRPQQMEKI